MSQNHDRCSGPPASAQAAIEAARAQLLTGRGPGASPQEITAHTRARPRLGGYPIPQRREQLTAHTALARSDPDPLTRQVIDTDNQIAYTITPARHQKIDPTRPINSLQLALFAAALGAVLGATATAHHRRHRNR